MEKKCLFLLLVTIIIVPIYPDNEEQVLTNEILEIIINKNDDLLNLLEKELNNNDMERLSIIQFLTFQIFTKLFILDIKHDFELELKNDFNEYFETIKNNNFSENVNNSLMDFGIGINGMYILIYIYTLEVLIRIENKLLEWLDESNEESFNFQVSLEFIKYIFKNIINVNDYELLKTKINEISNISLFPKILIDNTFEGI